MTMRPPPHLLLLIGVLAGCNDLSDTCQPGKAIAALNAIDATTVELAFGCRVEPHSAADAARYEIGAYTAVPPELLPVVMVEVLDDARVRLLTAPQTGGVTYTLRVDGVLDMAGAPIVASKNFIGLGERRTAKVTFVVDDRYHQRLTRVALLVSVDPATGAFSPTSHRLELADHDGDHRFEGTLAVAVDPARTVDEADDLISPAFVAYNARALDAADRPLSDLVLFAVTSTEPQRVEIPLRDVPDPPGPEGLATVRFVVDDRPARALSTPSLAGSFDGQGRFDPSFPALVPLTDDDGDGLWEATAKVRIDPRRTIGGETDDSRPYSVYLVEDGEPHSARSADFTVPDEKDVEVSILIGAVDRVPVTFAVDVSSAWLDLDGSQRGLYPGEAVFLTGEFGQAEDAFGRNASDAFSGGENVVLQMVPRPDRPGVWQRTIFLPRNRPYGWKVVRCPQDKGCSQLNKMVTSSGRAFPTVMKNLATELCDLGTKTWTDPDCSTPRLIDPRALSAVDTGQGVLDYSGASIFGGTGAGLADQKDPPGTPDPGLMFKQESPDLVVEVGTGDEPVVTPVYVIGTWRDVNIPGTPADIATSGQAMDLGKTDYDAGMIGAPPPAYELPPAPVPSPFVMDGVLDAAAQLVAGGSGQQLPIHAALSSDGQYLYLATDDAGEGSDHFLFVSATPPGSPRPAPWGKAGQVAFGAGRTLFLADENDSDFAGWFELGTPDVLLLEATAAPGNGLDLFTSATNGTKLEGVIHLATVFGSLPTTVYVAVAPWSTEDGGALYPQAQAPASKDGDGDVDADEILALELATLK